MTEPGKPPEEIPDGAEIDNPNARGMREIVREAEERANQSEAERTQRQQDNPSQNETEPPGRG